MTAQLPPLRYLSAADVRTAMPPVEERLTLAERTMTALATEGAAELPPKLGVHPRPSGSFAHAMPAHLRAEAASGAAAAPGDLLGMKWVSGFSGNNALGIPAINALVLLNDPATGVPIAILDGTPITADRTAAVSGTAIRHFAPRVTGRAPRAGIIGSGAQGRSHLPVLGHLLPGVEIRIFDRHPERAAAFAEAATNVPGIGAAAPAASAREAAQDADVVVSAAAFTTPDKRQSMTPDWLTPDALVVPVDYATMCSAAVAEQADLFLVDERGQFEANRDRGEFDNYPDPAATIGEAILAHAARPGGRVVATHLGVGLADVVFGAAILERAAEAGLGLILPR